MRIDGIGTIRNYTCRLDIIMLNCMNARMGDEGKPPVDPSIK